MFGIHGQGYYLLGNPQVKRPTAELGLFTFKSGYKWEMDEKWMAKLSPQKDYTIAVTFYAVDKGNIKLFTVQSSKGEELYTASWDGPAGRLVLEAKNPHDVDGDIPGTKVMDLPWDMTAKVINKGISPFNLGSTDWNTTAAEPSPGLVELYFRFGSDGKVRIDMATLKADTRELMVSHTQEMGRYVSHYPSQTKSMPSSSEWEPPTYIDMKYLEVGKYVTQISVFNKLLTDNEVMGFHASNLYFDEIRSSYDVLDWHDKLPCNSGEWMNKLRYDAGSKNYADKNIDTVCGSRYGTRYYLPGSYAPD